MHIYRQLIIAHAIKITFWRNISVVNLAVRCEVNSGPASQFSDRLCEKNNNSGEAQAKVLKCHFVLDSHLYHIQTLVSILQKHCNDSGPVTVACFMNHCGLKQSTLKSIFTPIPKCPMHRPTYTSSVTAWMSADGLRILMGKPWEHLAQLQGIRQVRWDICN